MKPRTALVIIIGFVTAANGCSTMKSVFATNNSDGEPAKPIQNPFTNYSPTSGGNQSQNMILRTKKGDRAIEIEIPNSGQNISDFTIPVSPAFKDANRGPASSDGMIDESYKEHAPTMSDREIIHQFPHNAAEDDVKRREIEQGLGLVQSEDPTPENPKSYLAAVAYIKQLYIQGKYEQALIETDTLIRQYQTDSKLYSMRGTLLDRLGKTDLAIKSWNQALRFEPNNTSLKKFIERRERTKRGVASP